jgi:peptide/nickel transport system substrate-binding protein
MPQRQFVTLSLILVVVVSLLTACAGPAPGRRSASGEVEPGRSGSKRLVAAVMAEPSALHRALIGAEVTQVKDIAFNVVNIGLTVVDDAGARHPALAEAVPTLENGMWRLLPDGQMELVWKLRPGATWHDGTPLTAGDLQFTVQVLQDRELPEFRTDASDLIERTEVLDGLTLSTIWKGPFIRADRLFYAHSEGFGQLVPRHLLERHYVENKDGLRQLPYWTTEFIGAGPYRLKDWVHGSHLLVQANESYVLGRPKIDEIEIRFIYDGNAVAANLLAGAVHTSMGSGLSLEQTLEVRDQWRDGRLDKTYENWVVVYPQFVNPSPAIIADVRFRRALLMAIDRQAMADEIQAGLVPVAHNYVRPDEPEFRETDRYITKYEYDPRRAMEMLEGLGYSKGSDGGYRDGSGQRLSVEIRATTSPTIHTKSMFPVADYWQRLGLAVDTVVIPLQGSEREYRATRPGFDTVRQPQGPAQAQKLHSTQAPMPANRFQGQNHSRYMNPEFDALIDQYLTTLPAEPRLQLLGQIVGHMSDQLNVMGLFYDLRTTLVSNRLQNTGVAVPTWNVHQWELKS